MTASQWAALLFALIALVIEIIWANKYRAHWLMAVPMIIWLLHSVVYYLAIVLIPPQYGVTNYSDWSSVLRLHGYMTIAMIGAYRIWRWRVRYGH